MTTPKTRTLVLALVALMGVVAASCSSSLNIEREGSASGDDGGELATPTPEGSDPGPDGPVPTPTATSGGGDLADWTFMVYVLGDNDLEPFAVQDVLEMASVGSTDDVNIVALVDRTPDYTDESILGVPDFDGARMFEVGNGELVEIAAEEERNMGDPSSLAGFITGSVANYPAQHYALVLWDHGAGWPGIGPDESNDFDVLDMADLNAALSAGLSDSGIAKLDLIGFDACLMATYEVASIMAPYADYMLASQELEPGHGWNYAALQALTANPSLGPVELAGAIQQGFEAQALEAQTDAEITLSLVDLNAIGALQTELAGVQQIVAADPATAGPVLGSLLRSVPAFGDNPDPELASNLVDLGVLLDGLGDAGAPARAALDAAVISQVVGPARSTSTGLSVYFPATADYFRQGYLFLEGVPAWPDLLETYYTAGAAIPEVEQPEFQASENQAEYFFDEDGLNIYGTFNLSAENNLVGADIYYGVYDDSDGSIIYLGREDGEVSTDGSGLAAAIFNLEVLQMGDGVDIAYAYIDLTFDFEAGYALADIPLAYAAPGVTDESQWVDVVLSLVVDFNTELIEEYTFYEIDEFGNWGELIVDPNGFVYPVVQNVYPDGSVEWIPTIDVGLYSDYDLLTFEFVPLDPGTPLYAELVVYDYGGNSDYVSMLDFIP